MPCDYAATKSRLTKLMEIIRRDRQFWGNKGGITLTGGEPLLQIDFVKELLAKCHQAYIHTAIETCGNVPWKTIKGSPLPRLDFFSTLKISIAKNTKKLPLSVTR